MKPRLHPIPPGARCGHLRLEHGLEPCDAPATYTYLAQPVNEMEQDFIDVCDEHALLTVRIGAALGPED